jgi:NAD(P)-dependent dehydrogenase (short-subunit alcohol dehydrogenase family)
MRFDGKTILVSGGGSGIGRAAALRFAAEGGRVAVVCRTATAGEAVAAEIAAAGGKAVYVPCDVSDPGQVESCVNTVVARLDGLHILVNAAGTGMPRNAATEVDESSWTLVVGVNLGGAYRLCRFAVPAMAKAGGGSIVNIASTAGISAIPRNAPYVSSKGGLIALTRSLAMDYAAYRIRANCVCPGSVRTPMLDKYLGTFPEPDKVRHYMNAAHPLGGIGRPEDVAAAILFLASDEASWITGAVLPVDGGYLAGKAAGVPPPIPGVIPNPPATAQ